MEEYIHQIELGNTGSYGTALEGALQTLLDKEAFGQRRLLRAFPKMRSTDHKSALERLRRRMERR